MKMLKAAKEVEAWLESVQQLEQWLRFVQGKKVELVQVFVYVVVIVAVEIWEE